MTHFTVDISPHLTLEMIDIVLLHTLDGILEAFQVGLEKIQSFPEHMTVMVQCRQLKILVVVDVISFNPGILISWEWVVEFCKTQKNMRMLVDATHAIGHIVGINLYKTQPDFIISVSSTLAMLLVEAEC